MIEPLQRQPHSTRYIFGGVLAVMVAAIGLVALLGHSLRRENVALLEQIIRAEEAARPYLDGDRTIPLPALLAAEQRVHETLQAEWDALVSRVDTFDAGMALFSEQPEYGEEGRIDFKVALYNARTNLQHQARLRGRTVPENLGMPETISADQPAEVLLWQLTTVVRFMEQAIELGIPEIEQITPLPPTAHRVSGETVAFAREFPFRTTLRCSFADFYRLHEALLRPRAYFALRRFELFKTTPDEEQNLLVRLVYAGEVFEVLNLAAPVAVPAAGPAAPLPGVEADQAPEGDPP